MCARVRFGVVHAWFTILVWLGMHASMLCTERLNNYICLTDEPLRLGCQLGLGKTSLRLSQGTP